MPGGNESIGIDKPPRRGIVISALQIIEPRLGVVIIPSVAEGIIIRARMVALVVVGLRTVSPGIICVRDELTARRVIDADDVALQVLLEPIGVKRARAVLRRAVEHSDRATLGVVEEEEQMIAPALADDLRAVQRVGVCRSVYDLPCADAVGVVGVRDGATVLYRACKPSAVRPREGVARPIVVRQRVADRIVGEGNAVIRGELVAPVCIGIAVGVGALEACRGGSYACRSQGVDPLREDIRRVVVGVNVGLSRDAVVLAEELTNATRFSVPIENPLRTLYRNFGISQYKSSHIIDR